MVQDALLRFLKAIRTPEIGLIRFLKEEKLVFFDLNLRKPDLSWKLIIFITLTSNK